MNLKDKTVVIDNKTYRYSKIVMLNSKKSNIGIHDGLGLVTAKSQGWNYITSYGYIKAQYLYFLSTDKICEGDWYYEQENNRILQCKSNIQSDCVTNWEDCSKIIASTDTFLNLPKPSDSFLQVYIDTYNKGEKIEECLIEYEEFIEPVQDGDWNKYTDYKLKITKGEITIRKVKDSWSRKEVEELCKTAFLDGYLQPKPRPNYTYSILSMVDNWISQNLK